MKKLLLALAIVCSVQAVYAQKVSDSEMQKAVDKALAASLDAKKSTKPATWINLGKAYLAAYHKPLEKVTMGVDKNSFKLMVQEKVRGTSKVKVGEEQFEKQVYSRFIVYFNPAGQLVMAEVTRQTVPGDLLGEAAKAYSKAFELGAKPKDVTPKMKEIIDAYYNDAFTAYSLNKMAKASDCFKGAADASLLPGSPGVNDDAAYNCAFTALSVKNYDRAEEYYKRCLANNFTSEGNIYSNLSECALAKKDTVAAKSYLVNGLTAYPNNAGILTNLINLYLNTNEDPEKIVELLDEAKKAMPDNASLYLVEGNIYGGIKKFDKAMAAYDKALEIDPNYDIVIYYKGYVNLQLADELLPEIDKAEAARKWTEADALEAQRLEYIKASLPYFEKAYEISSSDQIKSVSAQYLKSLYFQLRNKGYQEQYEKWNAIVSK